MEERELFALLERAGDAAFAVDQQGLIRYWSSKAQELLGFRTEQVLLKNCAEVLAGTDEVGAAVCCRECHVLEIARRNGTVAAYDLKAATAGGGHKWLNMSILVARLRRGRPCLVVHLMRDVDRRKQTELLTREILVSVGRLTGQEADDILRRGSSPAPTPDLTARERAILQLVSLGCGPKQIGENLHISPATARNHIQHILGKLGCHTRLEAAMKAMRERLI
ncbi:MAG: PAS domain S-box protein [Acidobacteria bacterium]|nr:PAS domain S-box protein [Acidobacteriota bacterium]